MTECSAVAILTLTGKVLPDVPRTMAETVFAVEDLGYVRDTSPTRAWSGRRLREIVGSKITGLVFCRGHVCPIVRGELSNVNGYGDEPITAVVAFARSGGGKPLVKTLFCK